MGPREGEEGREEGEPKEVDGGEEVTWESIEEDEEAEEEEEEDSVQVCVRRGDVEGDSMSLLWE